MFNENIPGYKFTGLAWLFMGVANSDATLYDDELQAIKGTYPDQVCMRSSQPCSSTNAGPGRQCLPPLQYCCPERTAPGQQRKGGRVAAPTAEARCPMSPSSDGHMC